MHIKVRILTKMFRPDWHVWWCERGVCWWHCILLLLPPLQALHTQGYQEAGKTNFFILHVVWILQCIVNSILSKS